MESISPRTYFRSSLLLYLFVSIISFFPSLFLQKAYFPNDLINYYSQHRFLLRAQLMQGHFPFWNPYLYGGQPFFADPNVMMCYPLNYLTFLFPPVYGLGVFLFLHMFLAATGMHLLLKALKVSDNACRIGALTFALSGCFWWEVIHPPILAAYAWFPWQILCLENLSKKIIPIWAFLSGLCFAVVFCCGNFQSTTCIFYTSLVYFLFRILIRDETNPLTNSPEFPWKKIGIALLFVTWGSLPLLSHLIPVYEFSKYSNRRSNEQTYENFNGTFSMVPQTTYEFLFPSLGLPPEKTIEYANQEITNSINIDNDFLGVFGYLGIWVPFFFFLAFKRKEKKFLYFLTGISLLSIMTAWGRYFPLHHFLCTVLPGVNLSRAPFRFVQAYMLLGCVLLAYGYQTMERILLEKGRSSQMAFFGGIYTLFFFIIGIIRPNLSWRELIGLALGAAGLLLCSLTESWVKLGKWFLQTGLILPLLLSGWGDFSQGPLSNYDYETNFPAFTYLKENSKGCRYYFDQNLSYPIRMGGMTYKWMFPQDAPMEFGIRDSGGYNPIYLNKSFEIRKLPFKTYVQLMCIRGMLFGEDRGETPDFIHKNLGSVHLYEPKIQSGFVNAPFQFQVISDEQKNLQALAIPSFDPSTQVIFNESIPPNILAQLPGHKANLQYEILKDEMDSQLYMLRLDANSFVTFSEIVFPGWKAWVDGQPSKLLTANHIFRALFVPAGEHKVEFRYEPAWAKPLLAGFILWFLSALAIGLFQLRKKSISVNPPSHE